jgi:hypothetical protein
MTDALIDKVTARRVAGRLRPMLLVKPTGYESGFLRRKTRGRQWVAAEHVRLILTAGELS